MLGKASEIKVRALCGGDTEEMNREIEEFLIIHQDADIIDIKYQRNEIEHFVLIIYKEAE